MNITAQDLATADRKLFEVYLKRELNRDDGFGWLVLARSDGEIRGRLPDAPPGTRWVVCEVAAVELDEMLSDVAARLKE